MTPAFVPHLETDLSGEGRASAQVKMSIALGT